MVDVWRAVPVDGFEHHYEVSDSGRVRRRETGRVLKPGRHPKGYSSVVLSVDGSRRTVLIHRLVLLAFVGPPEDGLEARHLDGDRTNNALANLLWGTPSENTHDKRRHGTMTTGERNGQAKVTDDQALEIIARCQRGESQRAVARDYGISQPQVSRIVSGKQRAPTP